MVLQALCLAYLLNYIQNVASKREIVSHQSTFVVPVDRWAYSESSDFAKTVSVFWAYIVRISDQRAAVMVLQALNYFNNEAIKRDIVSHQRQKAENLLFTELDGLTRSVVLCHPEG